MGSRGNARGRNSIEQEFLSSLKDYELRNIARALGMGGFGTKQAQEAFMLSHGITEETLSTMDRLLDRHRLGEDAQKLADAQIVQHLESMDSVGQALLMQIELEEALYRKWAITHDREFVYRKGNRKDGVESWTSSEEGADMGYGGIGWDHRSTVSELLSQGYRILGGFGRHLGSPGEAEITFVKYRRRK